MRVLNPTFTSKKSVFLSRTMTKTKERGTQERVYSLMHHFNLGALLSILNFPRSKHQGYNVSYFKAHGYQTGDLLHIHFCLTLQNFLSQLSLSLHFHIN